MRQLEGLAKEHVPGGQRRSWLDGRKGSRSEIGVIANEYVTVCNKGRTLK